MLIDKVEIKEKITIEELRTLVGKSQKEFAEDIGMPSTTYIKKARGITPFLASEFNTISNKYHVPMGMLEV